MPRPKHRDHKPPSTRFSRHPASAEQILWRHLLDHRAQGIRWKFRVRIEGRVFPFYCAAARLAIALDIETRGRSKIRDYKFDAYLLARGILVEHFGRRQIRQAPKQVADQILDTCRKRTAPPPTIANRSSIHSPPPSLRRRIAKPSRRLTWVVGIAVAAILTVRFFQVVDVNALARRVSLTANATPLPDAGSKSAIGLPISVASPPPTLSADRHTAFSPSPILALAEKYLDSQPQYVIDLLIQNKSQFTSQSDLADAYSYLGRAEMELKHYQAAANYFKQLYALEPSMEYLYALALAYDLGGDWQNALANYRALAQSNGNNFAFYRELAQRRIVELQSKLVTPAP